MKRSITLALVFSMTVALSITLAQSGNGPEWVSGKITSIFEDQDGALMSLEMADGEPYNVSVSSEMIKGISIGDEVTVEINRGWAEVIEKADAEPAEKSDPAKTTRGPQWVSGRVVAIEKGPENSLLSIKMSNDKVFNVALSNDKLEGIKQGDFVTAKVLKGWAKAVSIK